MYRLAALYSTAKRKARCGFCGGNAQALIARRGAAICQRCAEVFHRTVQQELHVLNRRWRFWTPREIKTALDEAVIGQAPAKRVLAVALHNHYRRLARHHWADGTAIGKSNVLVVGPPGTGKTLLARSLAEIAEVPFVSVDVTSLTGAGYVGEDVEVILQRLLGAAEGDPSRAQWGIVHLDQIDKLARRIPPSQGRDVAGEAVQQGLLAMLEGRVFAVPSDAGCRGLVGATAEIDTTDILFICTGSFAGIERLLRRRRGGRRVGFGRGDAPAGAAASRNPLRAVLPEDLVAYGLIPELVGRLPVLAALDPLDEADLLAVLTAPLDAPVRQYQTLFALSGTELQFEADALRAIARRALARGQGARGLRAILDKLLLAPMFDLPDRPPGVRFTVDRAMVESGDPRRSDGPGGRRARRRRAAVRKAAPAAPPLPALDAALD